MTIDEAMEQEIAFSKEDWYKRKQYHEQLAEWLEELKSYRASVFSGDMTQKMLKEEYCKAIDDFLEKIQWEYLNSCGIEQKEIEFLIAVSSQVAEQLKEGGEYA